MPRSALDLLDQHAAENVAPAYRRRRRECPQPRAARQEPSRSGSPPGKRRQEIDAGKARRKPRRRSAVPARRTDRPTRPRKVSCRRPGRLRRQRQDRRAVGHQRLVRLAGAIPFDQREFRMMQRAALAVAEHPGELEDAALAGGQQLLAGEFRRGAQIKRRDARRPGAASVGGEGVQMGLVARAKPARPRSRPRRSRRAANQARSAARSGRAPAAPAGGRRERAGPRRARRRA